MKKQYPHSSFYEITIEGKPLSNFARGVIKTQGSEEAVRKNCPPVSGLSLEVNDEK